MTCKLVGQYWVPEYETLLKNTGRPYQEAKFQAAMQMVTRRSMALDVGAHVGMWTLQMLSAGFSRVIAFEPDPEKFECFNMNVSDKRCELLRIALGDRDGMVGLVQKAGTSMKTHVAKEPQGSALPMHRLDALHIAGVDLLKIDVEGFDYFVVVGGEQTIRRDRPVVVVEQKPNVASQRYGIPDTAAVTLLHDWGYRIVSEMHGDYIMIHHDGVPPSGIGRTA